MIKRLISLLTVLTLIFGLGSLALGEAAPDDTKKPDVNEYNLPYLINYFDGTKLDLSEYEGKAIFINFFTSWCGYCIDEMPYIKQAFDEYSKDELAIILVHSWSDSYSSVEDESKTAYVKERFNMKDMTFIEDEDLAITERVGLEGFPTSIFIDKEGYLLGSTYALTFNEIVQIMGMLSVARAEAE